MYPILDKQATGRRIRRLMDAAGVSVKDVQQYLGLSCVQSVYHWLDGSSMPTMDNIYALSELLQTPVDVMLCGNRHLKKPDSLRAFGAYAGRAGSYYALPRGDTALAEGLRLLIFPPWEPDTDADRMITAEGAGDIYNPGMQQKKEHRAGYNPGM